MGSWVIDSETDRKEMIQAIAGRRLPFTVDVTKGKRRSVEQNKLQRLWLIEIAEQLGYRTAEEVRGYCKLTLGVPILRAENERFRDAYDRHIKGLPYEQKLAMMMEPLDLPVTRLMTTDQHTRYLDALAQHFCEQGVRLTDPEGRDA